MTHSPYLGPSSSLCVFHHIQHGLFNLFCFDSIRWVHALGTKGPCDAHPEIGQLHIQAIDPESARRNFKTFN